MSDEHIGGLFRKSGFIAKIVEIILCCVNSYFVTTANYSGCPNGTSTLSVISGPANVVIVGVLLMAYIIGYPNQLYEVSFLGIAGALNIATGVLCSIGYSDYRNLLTGNYGSHFGKPPLTYEPAESPELLIVAIISLIAGIAFITDAIMSYLKK